MKKLLFLVSFLMFQMSNAQIIPIPDANFKTFLTYTPQNDYGYATNLAGIPIRVDSNFDNQISVQEAANVAGLEIYNNAPVANLSGLEFFINLKYLSINSSILTSFNFPTLIKLEELVINIYYYIGPIPYLTSALNVLNLDGNTNLRALSAVTGNTAQLNLSNNINLEYAYLITKNVSNFDLSNNSKLKTLSLETGNIANLSFPFNSLLLTDVFLTIQNADFNVITGNANLRKLNGNFIENGNINLGLFPKLQQINFSGTGLTNLVTNNNPMLYDINIENSNLTNLDFSSNLNLETIIVKNSNLQSVNMNNLQFVKYVDLSNNKLPSLDFSNLFNLSTCYVYNNLLTSLSVKNGSLEAALAFAGNPNLQSICCDANETVYVQNQCNFLDYANTNVTANCSGLNLSTENVEFEENKLALYPNPASSILNIATKSIIDSISVSDINGRYVATNLFDSNKIDVQNLQSGIYFIRIATDSETKTLKFVKE